MESDGKRMEMWMGVVGFTEIEGERGEGWKCQKVRGLS
jgi:hypothetical protein